MSSSDSRHIFLLILLTASFQCVVIAKSANSEWPRSEKWNTGLLKGLENDIQGTADIEDIDGSKSEELTLADRIHALVESYAQMDEDQPVIPVGVFKRTGSSMPVLSSEQRQRILKELKNHKALATDREDGAAIFGQENFDDRGSPLSFGTDLDALSIMLASRLIGKNGRMRSVRHHLTEIGKR